MFSIIVSAVGISAKAIVSTCQHLSNGACKYTMGCPTEAQRPRVNVMFYVCKAFDKSES